MISSGVPWWVFVFSRRSTNLNAGSATSLEPGIHSRPNLLTYSHIPAEVNGGNTLSEPERLLLLDSPRLVMSTI